MPVGNSAVIGNITYVFDENPICGSENLVGTRYSVEFVVTPAHIDKWGIVTMADGPRTRETSRLRCGREVRDPSTGIWRHEMYGDWVGGPNAPFPATGNFSRADVGKTVRFYITCYDGFDCDMRLGTQNEPE